MSNQHVLKIHPAPLADLLSGAKTAEVRRNDRGFQVGDTVRLMEVNPETGNLTGAADHIRTISHIQTGYGLPDGMCVLSYADTAQREAQAKLAEAVGLLWFIQGYLEEGQDSNVKSKIRSFISRHRLDEHAQAEQQEAKPVAVEAQGAQAGDERAAFEESTRKVLGVCEPADFLRGSNGEYLMEETRQLHRICELYRAALATQPEVPEQYEYWCIAFGRWRPIQELVEFLTSRGFKVRAVRGAEHE